MLATLATLAGNAGAVAGAAPRPRLGVSARGLTAGRVDRLGLDLPRLDLARVPVQRCSLRARDVRVAPGFPPRLRTGPVTVRVVVTQSRLDRWLRSTRVPLRLALTELGVAVRTGVAGVVLGEVLTDIEVSGPFLRLRPRRMRVAGVGSPLPAVLSGYLPLPPLPRGARLRDVVPGRDEIAVTFGIDGVDEALGPHTAVRMARAMARWAR